MTITDDEDIFGNGEKIVLLPTDIQSKLDAAVEEQRYEDAAQIMKDIETGRTFSITFNPPHTFNCPF